MKVTKTVYCKNCEYLLSSPIGPVVRLEDYECTYPDNTVKEVKINWYERVVLSKTYRGKPSEINANNDCPWFTND